jgi:hypothetical protein
MTNAKEALTGNRGFLCDALDVPRRMLQLLKAGMGQKLACETRPSCVRSTRKAADLLRRSSQCGI